LIQYLKAISWPLGKELSGGLQPIRNPMAWPLFQVRSKGGVNSIYRFILYAIN